MGDQRQRNSVRGMTPAKSGANSSGQDYHLAPSGVLCEGYGEMDSYARTDWPQLNSYACTAHLVVVSEADYEVKMARALELVMPGRPSVHLRHEMSLTYWLSGNALLQAGVTCPSGSTGPLSTVYDVIRDDNLAAKTRATIHERMGHELD